MNLENFKRWLDLNYDSEKTKTNYFNYVRSFYEFSKGLISKELIEDYILDLKKRNKSKSAINLFLNSIKKYILCENIDIDLPKTKGIKKSERKFNNSFYFTEEDLNKIFKHIGQLYPYDYKDRELIILILFYAGLRPSELLNLKGQNLNFKQNEFIIENSKGNKNRYIPFLNNEMVRLLKQKQYCEKICNLTYAQINKTVKQIGKFLQINDRIEPRTFRRSFAKFCLDKGMDISYLKQIMGHEDIETTEIYSEPDKKMIHKKCEEIRNEKLYSKDRE